MTVRVLEDLVVDQIAAGEVVERPASVLKELIENSLDAGARRLDVRLKGGGADLVRVTDDGCGMDEADALLCIERHATSKIRSADDLLDVATLGFRGEALPSIASVSRFELKTRRADDPVGTALRLDGGRLEQVAPHAGPPGTEITVRSLFHAVPARRKFLRSAQTELGHCLEVVCRAVIRRPDVDVSVQHDGREVLRAPATDDPARRVRDLLGPDAEALLPVSHEAHGVRVEGLVSPVGVHRPTSAGAVYTMVHGRFVRDAVLRRAVQDAYRGALPQGRFPIVVLDVTVPRGGVDVNVHPAKVEVRFQHPRDVVQAVAEAVGAALRAGARTVPASTVRRREDVEQLVLGAPVAAEPVPEPVRESVREPVVPVPEPVRAVAPPRVERPPGPSIPALPPPTPWPDADPWTRPVSPAPAAPLPVLRAPTASSAPLPTVLAVVDGVALGRRGDQLLVVDVRAARLERTAARLREARDAGGVPSEPLLVPARVRLGRADADRVVEAVEALSRLGLEIAAFGPGELAVTAVPAGLEVDPAGVLPALAAALDRGVDALADALAAADTSSPDPAEAAALLAGDGARPLTGDALRALLRS